MAARTGIAPAVLWDQEPEDLETLFEVLAEPAGDEVEGLATMLEGRS